MNKKAIIEFIDIIGAKDFVKNGYGSGASVNPAFQIILPSISFLIGAGVLFNLYYNTINNALSGLIGNAFIYYLALLLICEGLLFVSAFSYSKTAPLKGKLKQFKKIFLIIAIVLFYAFLSPCVITKIIMCLLGKAFRIEKLTGNMISAFSSLFVWITLFWFLSLLSYCLIDYMEKSSLSINLYNFIGENAIMCYILLLSILLSNKIARLVFFKISKIRDVAAVDCEMTLLKSYFFFIVSLVVLPLTIDNVSPHTFFIALLCALTIIFELYRVIRLRKEINANH